VTANPINVAVLDVRRGYDRIEIRGLIGPLTLALALPDNDRLVRACLESEHDGAVVKRRDEQIITSLARRRDAQAGASGEWLRPVKLARFRIEAVDRLRVPDDKLALAAELINHRRRIARLWGRQCTPQLLAHLFVEGNHGAVLAADKANQLVS